MRSFPWDSVAVSIGEDGYPVYDRVYQASDLREVYETFFSNGVFMPEGEPSFAVSPGEDMAVTVDPGKCHIQGAVGYEPEKRTLALTASSNQYDRIDTVVLRWDSSIDARSIDLYVLAGAPSENPVRPTLTRSETVWELGLCDVFVPKNSLSVTADRITDTRLDNERCGVVEPFDRVDTTSFYSQLQAAVSRAVELADAALDDTIAGTLDAKIDEVGRESGERINEVDLKVDDLAKNLWKTIFPIGAFYLSNDATSPASIFGGTWTKLTGYFLRGGSDTATGGADSVTLSTANLPSHTHSFSATTSSGGTHSHSTKINANNTMAKYSGDAAFVSNASGTMATGDAGYHNHTVSGTTGGTGSGSAFSNMPKYRNLHVWYRTA